MIRVLGIWLLLSLSIGILIELWRFSTNKERWQLTKSLAYAILCGSIASVLLSFVVFLF